MKNSKIKLKKFIIAFIFLLFVSYNTIYVIGHELNNKFNIQLFGKQQVLVKEDSMEPEIKKNDVLIVDKNRVATQNDIIAFYKNDKIIIRRVESVSNSNNQIHYVTKGDNNLYADSERIEQSEIEGTVIGKIKHVSLLYKAMHSKILTVFNTVLLIMIVMNNQRKKKKELRRKKLKELHTKNKDL